MHLSIDLSDGKSVFKSEFSFQCENWDKKHLLWKLKKKSSVKPEKIYNLRIEYAFD